MPCVWGGRSKCFFPAAEIVIVDHHSIDATPRIAREYGARSWNGRRHPAQIIILIWRDDWILCLEPAESISESLQASLYRVERVARTTDLWQRRRRGRLFRVREAADWGAMAGFFRRPKPASSPVAGPGGTDGFRPMIFRDHARGELLRFALP